MQIIMDNGTVKKFYDQSYKDGIYGQGECEHPFFAELSKIIEAKGLGG